MNRREFLRLSLGISGAALFYPVLGGAQAAGNMKFFLQWARANPNDWVQSDAGRWASSQVKADPSGDTDDLVNRGDALLDNQPGWVFALNCQGVGFAFYDHYHVEDLTDGSGGMKITAWADDPNLYPNDRQADVVIFNPLAFDPRVGGTNTDQTFIRYREGDRFDPERDLPYSDFVPPTVNVKHGVYVSDAKWDEHLAARTEKGWRDWLGG